MQYNNGSAYGFVNTDWVGPSGQPIYFRNSVAGSGTWLLSVSGTQTPLAYINVSRSDASGGGSISASNITNTDCGNNTNWAFGSIGLSGSAYTQVAYQWYANQNSGMPGPTLTAANATTTLTSTGEAFRLRMLLAVDVTSSVAGADSFSLQFAAKGTGASCSSTQFSYTNITSSTAIAYNTNFLVLNGSAMTPTSTDPVDGGRTVVEQTYQSSNNFSVTSTIPYGEDGNWDFSLIDNGPGGTDYCFQAVFSSSTALYAYPIYPEIMTNPSSLPILSNVVLNGGNSNIILTPNITNTITVVASTSDPGGPGNIISATGTIYRTSLGKNCTANNLNCYQIPSSNCIFTGSTSTVTCTASVWYFAQSTGNPSSSFPSDSWTGTITLTNGGGATSTVNSNPANVNVLTAINLSAPSINYGFLSPNTNTGSTDQMVNVQNVGNSSSTLQVSGTAFTSGLNTFATSSQHYATSSFTFGGTEQQMNSTLMTVPNLILTAPTANITGGSYSYSRSITVTSNTAIASGTNANFPMLFSGTYSWLEPVSYGGRVQNLVTAPNGGKEPADLVFSTSATCTSGLLNFETESYTSSTGVINDWVNVPSLSAGGVIYACYGNSGVTTDQSHPSSTWNSNYLSVWHSSDNAANTTVRDSTANVNNATAAANTNTNSTLGEIGNAFTYNGSSYYLLSGSYGTPPSNVTIEAWIKPTSAGGVVFSELGQGTINTSWHDSQIEVETNNTIKACVWTGSLTCVTAASGITYGNWYHVVMSYNSSNTTLSGYVNGILGGATSASKLYPPGTLYYGLGSTDSTSAGNAAYFAGVIDEARVSNTAFPSSWILTEYNNQSSPSTFYSVGSEQSVAGGSNSSSTIYFGLQIPFAVPAGTYTASDTFTGLFSN